mmetsp:Transcript_50359/g.141984  ORF Transcript_50359/g.141984 Transcript_50359/m.141984 type:complete len:275 (-) Transcript_50359:215-1039(-)
MQPSSTHKCMISARPAIAPIAGALPAIGAWKLSISCVDSSNKCTSGELTTPKLEPLRTRLASSSCSGRASCQAVGSPSGVAASGRYRSRGCRSPPNPGPSSWACTPGRNRWVRFSASPPPPPSSVSSCRGRRCGRCTPAGPGRGTASRSRGSPSATRARGPRPGGRGRSTCTGRRRSTPCCPSRRSTSAGPPRGRRCRCRRRCPWRPCTSCPPSTARWTACSACSSCRRAPRSGASPGGRASRASPPARSGRCCRTPRWTAAAPRTARRQRTAR